MGKNYCKVNHKWCKYCRHRGCIFSNTKWQNTPTCPKRNINRTISLNELIKIVNFYDVISIIIKYWPEQKKNVLGYADVFNKLLVKKPTKTNMELTCKLNNFSDGSCISAYGLYNHKPYSIEFVPWSEWLCMNVSQKTIDSFSPEEIVAAALYEMTWDGYDENVVQNRLNKIKLNFINLMNKENNNERKNKI